MNIKRYSLSYTRAWPPLERPNGEWVRYSDLKLLLAENEALKDLAKMIIDAETADETLIKVMYKVWLNKVKQVRGEV